MQNKTIGLFDPNTGKPVTDTVKTGQQVIMAINCSTFQTVRNYVNIFYNPYYDENPCILIKVRIDPQAAETADIPCPEDPLFLKHLPSQIHLIIMTNLA